VGRRVRRKYKQVVRKQRIFAWRWLYSRSAEKEQNRRPPVRVSAAAKILSENVRHLRKGLGLSQADLAEAIGTDQQAVGLIEVRRSNPTLRTIENLALVLGTTVPELLTRSPRRRTGKT
jgi:DNA-binding XRE family transcriptional regulator